MDPTAPLRTARELQKNGRTDEALSLLRDAIRRGLLDPESLDKAGRFVQKHQPSANAPIEVMLLGQWTTSWLGNALTAEAWGRGSALRVAEGGYDTILQDLVALRSRPKAPDALVLLPWSGKLDERKDPHEAILRDELEFWSQAWGLARELGSRLIQVGYDWVTPGPEGVHLAGSRGGRLRLIRDLNDALRDALPDNSYFVDLDAISGGFGRARFYDLRRYFWTKQPVSEEGTVELAKHLWAGIRALRTGPKKVLVLDLDNTLWGGVVGETGPHGIGLGETPEGEAFRAIQAHARALTDRGVLLAVASKNNHADAREPFDVNPGMALKFDHIAAFEACWEPKGTTIARIAETLNLGLDSFVFLDDNPAEREQVRQALPDVEVVEVGEEPAEFLRALESGLWFEAGQLTEADRQRAGQYVVERERRDLRAAFTSIEDYLQSLEMSAEIRPVDEADLPRVVQLLAKTNQFNLTTRRHSQAEVERMLSDPRSVSRTFRVRDRFGDYGLVAVLLGVPEDADTIRINTWLMSCRVIGRTVEQLCLREFAEAASGLGFRRILGEFIPTKKNALVADLYDRLGFARVEAAEGAEGTRYRLDLDGAELPVTYVRGRSEPR